MLLIIVFLYAVVDCGPLDSPVNGLVDTSAGTTFSSTATYSCNLNFMVNGSSVRICTAEGVWGGQPPTCVGKLSSYVFVCVCLSVYNMQKCKGCFKLFTKLVYKFKEVP